jgi:glycosyltransferase involved in cell wall biosynthesis
MNRIVSVILPYYNRKHYLEATLGSFEYYYSNRTDLQIVIVDDGSSLDNMPDDVVCKYNLQIKLIRIKNKKGINPCYPYNVGVRESYGDIIVLSSPEVVHTCDMFKISNNFEKLTDDSYLQFSVFCLTNISMKDTLLSRNILFEDKELLIHSNVHNFYKDLGCNGYSFNNTFGSWYTHSKIKDDCFNFLSACTRDTYFNLNGFNEVFVKGTGYDDTDFRDRLLEYIDNKVFWYDDCVAIHIDHPACSNDNNTNLLLYNKFKTQTYEPNNEWGKLC